jgi:hypothetical protein
LTQIKLAESILMTSARKFNQRVQWGVTESLNKERRLGECKSSADPD